MRKAGPRAEGASNGAAGVIYNRLPVLRAERGLSRQQLADALGVNYQTIGYLERGEYNPSLELAFRLTELFGLPIDAIFSRQPFKPMSEELYRRSADTRE
jgi:putative transcriptional regulator